MGKSPGFWFFTGDWMKDPELRFCSIFARGLLVDLLCLMFESKRMGYLSKPNGEARDESEIVDAISGGDRQEKLNALRELVESGVLSRDSDGCVYSRRLVRLADVSKVRSKSGSKGGSKTQANGKANVKQNVKQNRGVTDSDSDSDSDTSNKYIETPKAARYFSDSFFDGIWAKWRKHRSEKLKPLGDIEEETQLMDLSRHGEPEAIEMVDFSIRCGALNLITNGNHKKQQPTGSSQTSQSRSRFSLKDIPV
jgi:hypothetical protein